MIEFLKKIEKRGIKITRVNSIFIAKSINLLLFTLILHGVGVCCDRNRFSVLSPFVEKSMVIYYINILLKCVGILLSLIINTRARNALKNIYY